jgi:hypothetical protein
MHLKVFLKLKKKPKPSLLGKKTPKNPKKPKKTTVLVFFKPGFFPTLKTTANVKKDSLARTDLFHCGMFSRSISQIFDLSSSKFIGKRLDYIIRNTC